MVEDFKLARMREVRRNTQEECIISPATVNRSLSTLKLIFNHAAGSRIPVENPTNEVLFLEEGSGRMRILKFEEELAYFQAAGKPLQDIARVVLETGMRPGEVYRMEGVNLDFDRRTIFNPFGKTRAAKRTIPMTAEVWNLLKQRAIAVKGRYAFPSPKNPDKPIGALGKHTTRR